MSSLTTAQKLMILLAAWLLLSGGGGLPVNTKPDAATYVYEKDSGGVPSAVGGGIGKLNAAGIKANTLEIDVTDGTGEIPDQYKLTVPAAKAAGLPSLVVEGGGKVIRVVKGPTTEEQVLEAVK